MPDGSSNRTATKKVAPKKSAKQKKAERTAAIIAKHRAALLRAVKTKGVEGANVQVQENVVEFVYDLTHAAVFAAIPGRQNTLSGEKAMDAAIKAVCAVVRKSAP